MVTQFVAIESWVGTKSSRIDARPVGMLARQMVMYVLFGRNRNAVAACGNEMPFQYRGEHQVIDLRAKALEHLGFNNVAHGIDGDLNDLVANLAVEEIARDDRVEGNYRQCRPNFPTRGRSVGERAIRRSGSRSIAGDRSRCRITLLLLRRKRRQLLGGMNLGMTQKLMMWKTLLRDAGFTAEVNARQRASGCAPGHF